jgi:hypothetical protein
MFPERGPFLLESIGAVGGDAIRRAYATLDRAWPSDMPKSQEAIYSVLAVAGLETVYGTGFGHGRNNWGAIQCGHGPPCGSDCFSWGDKHADGTGYVWCYRNEPTQEAAAAYLASFLKRKVGSEVLMLGSPRRLAEAMYDAHYYEGRGATREERVSGYAAALESRFREIAAAADGKAGPWQTIPAGSEGGGVFLLGTLAAAAFIWKRRARRG